MNHILYLLTKHLIIPFLGLGIIGGLILFSLGIYNAVAGNNTNSEFFYGVPLLLIPSFFVFMIIKFTPRKHKESIADYLFDAISWPL